MVFTHLVPTTEGGFQLHDITEQKRMYQQQVLCALPADVLAKVIVVVDKVSEDNSYCTPKEGVINLLSKVRVGDPTTSGLVNYLWAAAPFGIYFWQNGRLDNALSTVDKVSPSESRDMYTRQSRQMKSSGS